jgi:hypothetical protein
MAVLCQSENASVECCITYCCRLLLSESAFVALCVLYVTVFGPDYYAVSSIDLVFDLRVTSHSFISLLGDR